MGGKSTPPFFRCKALEGSISCVQPDDPPFSGSWSGLAASEKFDDKRAAISPLADFPREFPRAFSVRVAASGLPP